jgi:hypothetical protein
MKMDRQTDMTELIVPFHNFANALKMLPYIRRDTLLTVFLLNFILPLRHVIMYIGYSEPQIDSEITVRTVL